MQIKREKKSSILIPIIIFAIVFYIALRIMTQVELNDGRFELEVINNVLDTKKLRHIGCSCTFCIDGM